MFEYQAPVPWGMGSRREALTEKAVHRGLKQMKNEDKMSFRALLKRLQQEWARTEKQKEAAPTCPGSSLRVTMHDDEQPFVVQAIIIKDGWERRSDYVHVSVFEIPLAHYWDVTLNGEAHGQFSRWSRYDAWSVVRAGRKGASNEYGVI